MSGEMKDALLPHPKATARCECAAWYRPTDQPGYFPPPQETASEAFSLPAKSALAASPVPTPTDKAVGEFTTTELDTLVKCEIAYWGWDERELLDKVNTIIAEEAERLSDCGVAFAAESMRERIHALTASRAAETGGGST